mmetsp:Transcript_66469/g.194973  ORF Transcript_66469/g.194973 Transcript_66469/m.194973 type:complete len:206 (-) Transcript_66469:127-744(-)
MRASLRSSPRHALGQARLRVDAEGVQLLQHGHAQAGHTLLHAAQHPDVRGQGVPPVGEEPHLRAPVLRREGAGRDALGRGLLLLGQGQAPRVRLHGERLQRAVRPAPEAGKRPGRHVHAQRVPAVPGPRAGRELLQGHLPLCRPLPRRPAGDHLGRGSARRGPPRDARVPGQAGGSLPDRRDEPGLGVGPGRRPHDASPVGGSSS